VPQPDTLEHRKLAAHSDRFHSAHDVAEMSSNLYHSVQRLFKE
jgi:hypothetical protein